MRIGFLRLAAGGLAMLATATCGPRPYPVAVPMGLDLYAPIPDDNPLTRDRVELGRRLFFDSTLSADGSRSCASCHRPALAFSDSVAVSRGAFGRAGLRNSPSIMNVAYGSLFFWDGRASSLEDQVLSPIQDSLELGIPLSELEARLSADPGYRRAFRRAYRGDVSAPTRDEPSQPFCARCGPVMLRSTAFATATRRRSLRLRAGGSPSSAARRAVVLATRDPPSATATSIIPGLPGVMASSAIRDAGP